MSSPKTKADTENPLDSSGEPESHVRVKPETLRGRPFTEEDLERIIDRVRVGELTVDQAREEIVQGYVDEERARGRCSEEKLEKLAETLREGAMSLALDRQEKP
jgi:hypothetical protein